MNRGYAGFYNETYLRSSYEYAYAKYLDFSKTKWKYEEKVYNIVFKIYKPDFFIYDDKGQLEKIVEVKSRDKSAIRNAIIALEVIKNKYLIEYEVISYEQLLEIYKSLPFSLNSTITEWISSNNTTINKNITGRFNPHYNLKHNEQTKKKIGSHTKQLWASDSEAKRRMIEGLRKSGLAQKGKMKTPRIIKNCIVCGDEFKTLITSPQKYCTQKCAGSINIQKATEHYVKKRESIHTSIKEYIIEWSNSNKELVLETPFNKIKTNLQPLWDDIQKKFGVKDFRVISSSVFGEDRGRKELLHFMKRTIS
jgi:hypothetical protein